MLIFVISISFLQLLSSRLTRLRLLFPFQVSRVNFPVRLPMVFRSVCLFCVFRPSLGSVGSRHVVLRLPSLLWCLRLHRLRALFRLCFLLVFLMVCRLHYVLVSFASRLWSYLVCYAPAVGEPLNTQLHMSSVLAAVVCPSAGRFVSVGMRARLSVSMFVSLLVSAP